MNEFLFIKFLVGFYLHNIYDDIFFWMKYCHVLMSLIIKKEAIIIFLYLVLQKNQRNSGIEVRFSVNKLDWFYVGWRKIDRFFCVLDTHSSEAKYFRETGRRRFVSLHRFCWKRKVRQRRRRKISYEFIDRQPTKMISFLHMDDDFCLLKFMFLFAINVNFNINIEVAWHINLEKFRKKKFLQVVF